MKGEPNVIKGSAIDLICELSDPGLPEATYKWERDVNGVVADLGQGISWKKAVAEPSDEGTYACWGANDIGDGNKGELKLNVNEKPTFLGLAWPDSMDVKENEVKTFANGEYYRRMMLAR